jgi:class 3 adenylate cyclase/tetratricopeptide (TPR) repeat protein
MMQPLVSARGAAEAGVVTLLFTDVVGSTELLGAIGDDAAEDVRRVYFRMLRHAIVEAGGQEVKTLGDGFMVAFAGAYDAVRAAVAMQQAVARYNQRIDAPPLGVRVGIHVGEPLRDEEDYFGLPVVVARRLCDHAEGGEIVTSDLVRALVGPRNAFEFADLGQLELKGLSEPVAACTVEWEQRPSVPLHPIVAQATSSDRVAFVGRDEELARLRAAWEEARSGHRTMLVLAGEPGVGKSRLAFEFGLTVQGEGGVVLAGRSDEENLAPYQPFVEALTHHVAHVAVEDLEQMVGPMGAELSRLVPQLADRLPDLPGPRRARESEPESDRYRLFEAISHYLAQLSQTAPTLLLLDDLQWADKPTLLLLRHIMRSPQDTPLLIVGTYRDTDVAPRHPLVALFADLRRARSFDRLLVKGLNARSTAALIRAWSGGDPPTPFSRAVYEETEGNPFFIEEVLHHLRDSGSLQPGEGRWTSGARVEDLGIPEGVSEVIAHRLGRLSEPCIGALTVAAVIGRRFSFRILQQVAAMSEQELVDALDEALAAAIISEAGEPGNYTFSHALVRETLYARLGTIRRVRQHLRIGEVLETTFAHDLDHHLGELSYHFSEGAPGSDIDRAVDYATRAGDHALAVFAYEEAAEHFERALQALELADHVDESRRAQALLGYGVAHLRAGDGAAADPALSEAAEIARRVGPPELFGRIALATAAWFSGTLQIAVDPSMAALLEEALAYLPDADTPLRARLMSRLATVLYFSPGPYERRDQLSLAAVEIARKCDDPSTLAAVLSDRHVGMWEPSNVEERLATAAEILRVAEGAGDHERALEARGLRLMDLLELGQMDQALPEIRAFTALAEEIRQPVYLGFSVMLTGLLAILRGDFAEGERLSNQAAELASTNPLMANYHAAQLWTIWRPTGQLVDMGEAIFSMLGEDFDAYPAVRAASASLAVELGYLDRAEKVLNDLSPGDFAAVPRDGTWLISMIELTEAAVGLGDAKYAHVLYDLLTPFAGRVALGGPPPSACLGLVSHSLGRLAQILGRTDEALAHLRDAMALAERMGARPFLADAQFSTALVLLDTGQPDEAAELVEEARVTAEELGMKPLAARIAALAH